MVDNIIEPEIETVKFHSCRTPPGTSWYDLSVLTAYQQAQLNELKFDTIKKNQEYLYKHPEIRALIVLFVREIFKKLPKTVSIIKLAKAFFCKNMYTLEQEVEQYLETHEKVPEMDPTILMDLSHQSSVIDFNEVTRFQPPFYYYCSTTDKSFGSKEEEIEDFKETAPEILKKEESETSEFTSDDELFSKFSSMDDLKIRIASKLEFTPQETTEDYIMKEYDYDILEESTIGMVRSYLDQWPM